jgi:hypothetical protein
MLSTAGPACPSDNIDDRGTVAAASPGLRSFAIYALSRGKGVPGSARAVLARAETLLEGLREQGADITFTKKRVGLEGETRLCATFTDQGLAEETLERIRELTAGADLINLVVEPCDTVR